jgi:Secretion system C-terminal sorting domain/Concanavalin A-like lectin/glucanases superfamily
MNKLLLFITIAFMGVKALAQAPTSSLVAYFEFQNSLASSTSSDVFVNTGSNNATFVAAAHGQGVSFNGGTRLQIAALSESIINYSNSFTISWWEFRPAATPELDTYSVRMGQNVSFRYKGTSSCLPTTYSDRYQIDITTASNTSYCVTTNTHTSGNGGTWKHHTISKLNNVLKYYLNGVISFVGTNGKTLDVAGLSATTTNAFELGYGTSSTSNMIGTIDDLALYKRELSAGEIATLYQSGNAEGLPSTINVGDISISPSSQKIYYSVYGSGLNTTTKVYYGTTNPPNSGSSFVVGPTTNNAVLHEKLNTTITGLTPGVIYYYRVEAVNTQGSNLSTQTAQFFVAGGSNTPVVHFPFDGNSTSIDNTYSLNPLSTTPSYATNRNNETSKAVHLNNQKLSALIPGLPTTNSPRTVSYWAKQAISTNHDIYGWGTYTNNYAFGGMLYGNTYVNYGGSSGYAVNATISISDNKWHHYAIVYDGTTLYFYEDGIQQMSGNLNLSTQGTTLYIGGVSSNNLTGANGNNIFLDDFQVYNQWLTNQGVYGLYLSQKPSTLSSQNFNVNNLKATIYPNPAIDNFTIEIENEVKSVEIYSLQGQKVVTSNSKNIDVSNLSKGMYMVRIEDSSNAVATQKLIIE